MKEYKLMLENGYRIVEGTDVSDGYHTMSELYKHRWALTVALTKLIESHPDKLKSGALRAFRSKLHNDGTMFEGYFIIGIGPYYNEPVDDVIMQISYHYELKYWEQFDHCVTIPKAPEWDGHTSQNVIQRLLKL